MNLVLGCNLKNDRMISFRLQGKPFNITVIQVYLTKIMASGPITSQQIDGETVETVSDFFEGAPKKLQMVTAAMKLRRLLLGRKVMTNLDSIFWGRQWHPTPVLLPGKSNGTPPQYSCLENPMDRGAWWAAVHGVAKSRI